MNDLLNEMEADSSKLDTVDDTNLKTVAEVANRIIETEENIEQLEDLLKQRKKSLLKLTDEDLPAMLTEMGLSAFELEDGSKISVKQTYGAHIKVDNKEAAFNWLRNHEFDDLIKNTVSVNFGRNEDENARTFLNLVEKQGYSAAQKTDVHPSTLKAFVKERIEQGDEIPMELFGVFVGQRATIKRGSK
mgnify:FL=1|jgi:Asp-tRNA(Asn)/Glu-tRNA(Gln) amidotransferase B subunit|tara:strand:+ start:1109 stop:1675 length:567 start_codon:yes stop_codon:yes gene_type:complete